MITLGFKQDQIAKHLGITAEEVGKIIRLYPNLNRKSSKSRKPLRRVRVPEHSSEKAAAISSPPVQEIKPGIYLLTADDLLKFTQKIPPPTLEPPSPFDDFIPRESFQKQFGISASTVERYHKKGILRLYKLGSKQFIRKSEIVNILEGGL